MALEVEVTIGSPSIGDDCDGVMRVACVTAVCGPKTIWLRPAYTISSTTINVGAAVQLPREAERFSSMDENLWGS